MLDQVGNSENTAMKRLLSIERKFKKAQELKAEYVKFMNEYLELGHMRLFEPTPYKKNFFSSSVVIKKDAAATKMRIVFDASSKDSKKFLLNDYIKVPNSIGFILYCYEI